MSRMSEKVVAVFKDSKIEPGQPNWVYVADFDDVHKFVDWFEERRRHYNHVAVSKGQCNSLAEIDNLKAYLRGMLKVGKTPDFSEDEWDRYIDLADDMKHYEHYEFDKMIMDLAK